MVRHKCVERQSTLVRGLGPRARVFSCAISSFVNSTICVVIFVVSGGFWEETVFDSSEDAAILRAPAEIATPLVMSVGIGGFLGFIS